MTTSPDSPDSTHIGGECVECGHPFDPDESTDPETCGDCTAFAEWFLALTPDALTPDATTPDLWEGDR